MQDLDPREEPRYDARFVGGLTRLNRRTVAAFLREEGERLASFYALVELHILAQLRERYNFSPSKLVHLHAEAKRRAGMPYPFASRDLLVEHGRLWLPMPDGEVVDLGTAGQMGIGKIVEQIAERVEWAEDATPRRLAPSELVVIDPRVRWGEPVIAGTRVPTAALVGAWRTSGHDVDAVARLYELKPEQVRAALDFELSLAA